MNIAQQTIVYHIPAMDCPVEEGLIRSRLQSVPGIIGLECNLMKRILTVHHNLSSPAPVEAALKSIGMEPEVSSTGQPHVHGAASRIPWVRLSVAGAFAVLAEVLDLLWQWHGGSMYSDANFFSYALEHVPMLMASVTAIALSGLTTYKKGWQAVRSGRLNINALMSVAVTGAVCIGQFSEAAMVMVLFNISEAIESLVLNRARNAIRNLLALAPETAVVAQADGSWAETDIRLVPVGSCVRVNPGEKIALDGVLASGHSTVDQSPITGESLPVEKCIGDAVYAGTINTSGSFEFTTTARATETTLARIIHAVEDAQASRAPMQRVVDAFASYYTPAIFAIALLTALVSPLALDWSWGHAVYTALVLLVIGCPCALVISTPVSIVGGMTAATRHGILIKGGMFLELGRKLEILALDKTGTITSGKPCLTDVIPLGAMDTTRMITLAAGLAARSDHPVSKAIAANAAEQGISPMDVKDFSAIFGRGVSGVINDEHWYLGNGKLAEELGCPTHDFGERIQALEHEGKTVSLLLGREGIAGLFAVADTVRQSSISALRELKKLHVRTVMLTGDNAHIASAIARQAGVPDVHSSLLPEDKLRVVEDLESQGHVVGMVGDGINDAPALARAHIGFAMAGGGTDVAIETADVALMDDDLRKIPHFIHLSRVTWAILLQNVILALGMKALFFALTFTGHVTMWMAVFADVGTCLMAVANGLRTMRL